MPPYKWTPDGRKINPLDWNTLVDYVEDVEGTPGPKGDTGLQGPQGTQGTQGIQGQIGLQGEQGLQGNLGLKGDTGEPGLPGEQGLPGDTGPKGDAGDEGPQGTPGEQGIPGETGPKGDIGETGSQGLKGDTGETGTKGDKGDLGNQGIPGEQGLQGEQGIPGDIGPKGDKGDTGDTGPPGTTLHSGLTDVGENDHHTKFTSIEHDVTARHTLGTVVPHDALASLTEKSHTSLTDKGNNTHAQIDTHVGATVSVHGVGTSGFEDKGDKGIASGYAPLDTSSKIPTTNLGGAGADNTKYLRGDQSWQIPSGGGGVSQVPTYSWNSGGVVLTVINQLLMDLFNAVGSGKVIKIFQIEAYQRNTAGVTGTSICLEAFRTTDVGTSGVEKTADKMDTVDPNIPAEITCRTSPTGGATPTGNPLAVGNIYTEEGVNNQSQIPMYENPGTGARTRLTLREGEGIRIVSGPLGIVGTIALRIAAEVS